jgi:hypothetical protein
MKVVQQFCDNCSDAACGMVLVDHGALIHSKSFLACFQDAEIKRLNGGIQKANCKNLLASVSGGQDLGTCADLAS